MFTTNYWLTVVVAPLLPLLVGLVTKRVASPGPKAVLLLALSTITAVVDQLLADSSVWSKEFAVGAVVAFVIATGSHFGLYKPTGISDRLLPTVGLGKAPEPTPEPGYDPFGL